MSTHNTPLHQNSASNAFPHLLPAAIALLLLVFLVIFGDSYATALENEYVHVLAPALLPQSSNGSVMQQAAFRQSDLLPVYGSSEMLSEVTSFGAIKFFATYPTGFNVFDVAKGGDTSLDIAQNLAAIGPGLRGKKVVISFTPSMFLDQEVSDKAYAGNFSDLHANALAFSPELSKGLKRRAAFRMLRYPGTLAKDPILTFALHKLAKNTFLDSLLYDAVFPLGRFDMFILRMQDHFEIWNFIQNHPSINPAVRRQPQRINWNTEIATADAKQEAIANNNPYGIENNTWINSFGSSLKVQDPGSEDNKYMATINKSREWGDLEIVLEILKENGAKPLIMSRPINGTLYTAAGISNIGQQAYYNKLQDLVSPYQMPLVDFQNYTDDRFFNVDKESHTSRKGWVIVDQTMDAFFHGTIQ